MSMAVYEIETETEYASENVLNEKQAREQFDQMTKQMGASLDKWRQLNEAQIVAKDGNKRHWKITIKLRAINDC